MDCLHEMFSTLKISLRFVPANHRQLSFPISAWKSLEKVVVYKAVAGKAANRLSSDWSWSHLNMGPALWLEVGPLWKTRGILQYKILPGGSSLPDVTWIYLNLPEFIWISWITLIYLKLSEWVLLGSLGVPWFDLCWSGLILVDLESYWRLWVHTYIFLYFEILFDLIMTSIIIMWLYYYKCFVYIAHCCQRAATLVHHFNLKTNNK